MAANGSQIIPPVMGLGAFLMAVILGISYVEVAAAAILPAFLYMFTLALGVYALVQASPHIPFKRQKVDWSLFLWVLPSFLPSIMLIIVLLMLRYSANMAALWGIATLVAFSFLRPRRYRPSLKASSRASPMARSPERNSRLYSRPSASSCRCCSRPASARFSAGS